MASPIDNPSRPTEFPPIDFRAELNEEQYAAVTAEPGPALVLAGAGSGKTRALTYRVAWLLSQGVSPGAILLLTFTNKAAREMLGRVDDLTGIPAKRFWGGTFHHIGHKILRIHGEAVGLRSGFTIMPETDSQALLTRVIKDIDPGFLKNSAHPKPSVIANIISYARNTRRSIDAVLQQRFSDFKSLTELLGHFADTYRKEKLDQQVTDYDDLLEYWLFLLQQNPDVAQRYQERFQHILIDEYQDTNRLQSEIIDILGGHHQVMAVGDDAQCIYTWRGASFQNIMSFTDRYPGTVIYKIETNYRSTDEILSLANGVLAARNWNSGYDKELRGVRGSRQVPHVVLVDSARHQANFIIQRIQQLTEEGYQLGDIAILYRAHYHAMDLQVELSRRGVPFIITSGVRFFEQAHIRDLVAQLRFVANPRDFPAFERFVRLLNRVGEVTAIRLYKRIQTAAAENHVSYIQAMTSDSVSAKVPSESKDDWEQLALTLQQAEEALYPARLRENRDNTSDQARKRAEREILGSSAKEIVVSSPSEVVKIAIDGWYGDYLRLNYLNWESRRDDLDTMAVFAEPFDDMADLLAQLVLLSSETSERSVEIDDDYLRLTTVHQAKGLEFPIVFVIGLAEGLFPLQRSKEAGGLEEERRLFYVAITRARDELYLTCPLTFPRGGAPVSLPLSSFLEELPDGCYKLIRVESHMGRY